MAKMLTASAVEKDLANARALLEETEAQWHEGAADYKRLDAVKQEVAFRQGLLEAVTKREVTRRQEAEDEAARKIAEQKRRQKAEADLPVLEKKLMRTENLRAALLDLNDAFPGIHDNPVKYALAVFVDTYLPEVTGGPGRGALDKVRHEVLTTTTQRGQVEALRKEIAQAQETLAANNGQPTKGSVK